MLFSKESLSAKLDVYKQSAKETAKAATKCVKAAYTTNREMIAAITVGEIVGSVVVTATITVVVTASLVLAESLIVVVHEKFSSEKDTSDLEEI